MTKHRSTAACLAGLLGSAALAGMLSAAPASATGIPGAMLLPPPAEDVMPQQSPLSPQTAIFAGGCFWGIQGVFQHVQGVIATRAGYDGGSHAQATYEQVSTGETGNAESVKVEYDPSRISYGQLLQIFFSVALDPTQRNAQYPDSGTQYRSVLFTTSPDQQRVARAYIAQLDRARVFDSPIATAVMPDPGFVAAESYHQNFLEREPDNPYIARFDQPKLTQLKRLFSGSFRPQPVLSLADTK